MSLNRRAAPLLAFLLLLCPEWTSALTLVEGPTVITSGSTATVTWKTDVVCGSKVSYGVKADLLDQRASGYLGLTHSVSVEGLKPGQTYHFAVSSAREQLGKGSFTLGGPTATSTPSPAAAPAATATSTGTAATTTAKPKGLPPLRPTAAATTSTTATAAATALPKPPPTRVSWGYLGSLQDHYDRHGHDFQAKSPDDYAAQAWLFLQRAKRDSLPMKLDTDGTLRVWDGKTGAFAAYNRDGTAKTYFKPGNSSYWQRQPGRSIRPDELPRR